MTLSSARSSSHLGRSCRVPARSCAHQPLSSAVATDVAFAPVDRETQRVIAHTYDAHDDARLDADAVEVLEEPGLVLELVGDAFDRRGLVEAEGLQRARRPWRDAGHRVPVRAGLRGAEHATQALFHLVAHRMLDALGLLVRLPPGVAEKVDEHALRQPVT